MSINNQMFQSIKDALTKPQQSSNFKDVLKLEPDPKPYLVRFIPNIKDPSKTFFHYFNHGWKSVTTGQFVSAISPMTWNERDPIAEARFAIYKNGSEQEKEKSKLLNRRENWFANVFVVSDPKHPENNNKIKILRFGRKMKKIIDEAIEGEDAAEFGAKIFDLSAGGCNFKIKSEKQGDFITYDGSKFVSPSEIPGMTEDKIKETYNTIFDLEKIQPVKSYAELKQMLDEHYYGKVDETKSSGKKENKKEDTQTSVIPPTNNEQHTPEPDAEDKTKPVESDEVLNDEKIKELLAGLETP